MPKFSTPETAFGMRGAKILANHKKARLAGICTPTAGLDGEHKAPAVIAWHTGSTFVPACTADNDAR